MPRKLIEVDEKVPLKLTAAQRKLVLEDLTCLDRDYERMIRATPAGEPVMMTLDNLDDFAGYVAAEANHCDDKKKEKKLDSVFQKVQGLLDRYSDEEPPRTVKFEDTHKAKVVYDQAVEIALWAAQALVTAAQLRIKTRPVENLALTPVERDVLLLAAGVPKTIKNKLARDKYPITVADVVSMLMTLAEDLSEGEPQKQVSMLLVAKHLTDCLEAEMARPTKPQASGRPKGKPRAASTVLYQLKITLQGSEPPIWRRIQVQDCTLDELHQHIQTAMGWTNSHLHDFEIKGDRYGDPKLLDDGDEDFQCADTTTTMISDILPGGGKRFAFKYEYDFGDGWQHEILFEGRPTAEKRKKYPICLEGERACPPEDVGGVWGYQDFLEAIADPKHDQHEGFLEWCGGSFRPDKFDPKQATRDMKRGLRDWRAM